jgi:hypothetical protein
MSYLFHNRKVVVCGGAPLASAIIMRLYNSGFSVICVDQPDSTFLKSHLSFGAALINGTTIIENITGESISPFNAPYPGEDVDDKQTGITINRELNDRKIPVVSLSWYRHICRAVVPYLIVNCLPHSDFINLNDAELIFGILPFHVPGKDCHIAIEARHTYQMGRYYTPNCQIPPEIGTPFFKTPFADCQTPISGEWVALKNIGDPILYNEPLGKVNGIEIRSAYDGQIWGLRQSGLNTPVKGVIAQIFLGPPNDAYRFYNYRENAVAGAVLDAMLHFMED